MCVFFLVCVYLCVCAYCIVKLQEEVLKRFEKVRHNIRNGTEVVNSSYMYLMCCQFMLYLLPQLPQQLIGMSEGTQSCLPERPVLVYSQHGPFQLDKMVVR